MWNIIQSFIWNLGGLILSLLIIIALAVALISFILNRASGWYKKENRRIIYEWMKNKKKVLDKEKLSESSKIKREK